LDDWELFRDRVSRPAKNGETKLAMKRLHVILKAIMLRRTKDAQMGEQLPRVMCQRSRLMEDGKPILNLPGREVSIVQCDFDNEEREFYKALEQQTALKFNKVNRPAHPDGKADEAVFAGWHGHEQLYFRLDYAAATSSRSAEFSR
jgi:SNF2 family DNA or RNA helicase